MNFQELLEALRGGEAPDTIYDDLQGAYQSVVDGAAAAKADSEGAIEALNNEISRLKSQNFDLLMASQAEPAGESEEPGPDADSELDPGDSPEDRDELFTYERKN